MSTSKEKYAEGKALADQAEKLYEEAHALHLQEQRARPLAERLIYAAYSRCPCGAGLAYDPASESPDVPFKGPSYWDCSAIILGQAPAKGEPGSVQHTDQLPFAFYEIKSENQPSAGGQSTRPKVAA